LRGKARSDHPMTLHDDISIALAILAGLAVIATSAMYLRKSAQLSAYLDEHHPQFGIVPTS